MKKIAGKRKPDRVSAQTGFIDFLDYYEEEMINKALKGFIEEFEMSRDWREPMRKKWYRYWELYNGYSPFYENKPEWQAAYFIRKAFEIIETIKPRVMEAYCGVIPMFSAIPFCNEDVSISTQVEILLETRKDQTKLHNAIHDISTESFIYGSGIGRPYYDLSESYEGPNLRRVDIFDWYPDPRSSDIQKMRFCDERRVMHIDEIMEMQDAGLVSGIDKLSDTGKSNYFNDLDKLQAIGNISSFDKIQEKYHELIERHGKWRDPDTKEIFDVSAIIADRSILIAFRENNLRLRDKETDYEYAYIPFIKMDDVRIPGSVYGMGECEIAEHHNLLINDTENAVMDGLAYNLSPTYQVLRAGLENEDLDNIVFEPGAIIPTNYMGGEDIIRPVQRDKAFFDGWTASDRLSEQLRDTTGVHRELTGAEGGIRKTAFETATKWEEGMKRLKLKVQMVDAGFISELGRMWLHMDMQFTDTEVLARICEVGEVKVFAKLTPSKMKYSGVVQLNLTSVMGNKGVMTQKLLGFLEATSKIPEIQKRIDYDELLKYIAYALDIKSSKLVLDKKEVEKNEKKELEKAKALMPQPMPGMAPGMPGALPGMPMDLQGLQPGMAQNQALPMELLEPAPVLPPGTY